MGTDIHLWVEYKNKAGEWLGVDDEKTTCYACDGTAKTKGKEYRCFECEDGKRYIFSYSRRCYDIFAVLSPSGKRPEIKPISESRGIPEDYKNEEDYKKYLERCEDIFWDGYGSCYSVDSYHTLTQLKGYDWDSVEKEVTWIKNEEFYKHFIPALEKLAKIHGSSDNVRIVFYFDS